MPQSVPSAPQSAQDFQGGQQAKIGQEFSARKLNTPLDKITRKQRWQTQHDEARIASADVTSRPWPMKGGRKIWRSTPRCAPPRCISCGGARRRLPKSLAQPARCRPPNADGIAGPQAGHAQEVRVRRAANLIMFVVDASWSMAVAERMMATKGAIMSLLTDAYQRRDRVGLVVFQKSTATLVLPPTSSVDLAQRALRDIPVGGKTPLSAGLTLAHFT